MLGGSGPREPVGRRRGRDRDGAGAGSLRLDVAARLKPGNRIQTRGTRGTGQRGGTEGGTVEGVGKSRIRITGGFPGSIQTPGYIIACSLFSIDDGFFIPVSFQGRGSVCLPRPRRRERTRRWRSAARRWRPWFLWGWLLRCTVVVLCAVNGLRRGNLWVI